MTPKDTIERSATGMVGIKLLPNYIVKTETQGATDGC